MIPMLYAPNAAEFDTLGIGELSEAKECTVSEERNGAFTLKMKIPMTAAYADQINVGSLIVADASPAQPRQAFEVTNVKKGLDGMISISANHISYRLLWSILRPFSATGIAAVISRLNTKTGTNYVDGNVFTFETTLTNTSSSFALKDYRSVRGVLGGSSGSILQTFGGCYQFDNFTVRLLASRGSDKGVKLLYGKNLTAMAAEYDLNQPTACFPIWTQDTTIVAGTTIKESAYKSLYPYRRTVVHDFNDQFDMQPTSSDLNAAAEAWINGKGLPAVNLQTSFIPLHQTLEYKDLTNVESVEIDDTVHVYVPTLDVDVKAKVIKTVYNTLLDRYDSVEVGNFRTTITEAIKAVTGE